MFMLKVFKIITGYVYFVGNGVFPERFLNLCAKEKILVWDAKVDVNTISGKMYIKDYKNIKKIAKKSCMRLRVKKRYGLPFLIRRYRFRYGIPVGVIIFFLIIWYLSGLCLNISISGNTTVNKEKILNSLKQSGVYIGRKMNDIDAEKSRQDFLIKTPQFSWAAFNKKGCFVDVELVETTQKQIKNKTKTPCNIVAKTDGKILKIKAYSGRVSVKIGEAVAKGDLLVSGVIELTNKSTKFVHSNAEVIAQTKHKLEVFIPFNYKQKTYGNEVEKRSVISVVNVNIPLFFGEVNKPYTAKKKIKKYEFLGVELPIRKTTTHFRQIIYKKITLNEDTAKQLAVEKMNKKAEKTLKSTIKSSSEGIFEVKSDGILYKKVYFCEENIAKRKNILQ